MTTLYLAMSWFFGGLLVILGLASMIKMPIPGLLMIVMAMLFLPPSTKFFYEKSKRELSSTTKLFSIFILLLAIGYTAGLSVKQEDERLAAEKAQKNADAVAAYYKEAEEYFIANRELVVTSVKELEAKKDYKTIVEKYAKYLKTGEELDLEFAKIIVNANNEVELIEKAEATEKLLAELKVVPSSEYEKNIQLYSSLVALHPDDEKYKNKVSYYENKLAEQKKIELAKKERKKVIEKQFSAWDGSHNALEKLIKNNMNDPDSYEHVETLYGDYETYLIVKTTYRGKNVYGGVVKNFVKAKVSMDGTILSILDES